MKNVSTIDRIKIIQQHMLLEPDGIIGPDTLTAIENRLFKGVNKTFDSYSLVISRSGMNQLINHEIVSKFYYNKYLKNPIWPGGASGVTIGIGYDLGYNRASQIEKDWRGKVTDAELEKLKRVSGLKSSKAKTAAKRLKSIEITFDHANQIFGESVLPRYALSARKAYPGIEDLYPDAQAALLSLIYNRGTSMSGSRRKEMAAIKYLVLEHDYSGISDEILNMKRLWEDKELAGLLRRRDDEANLVLNADRKYKKSELIRA